MTRNAGYLLRCGCRVALLAIGALVVTAGGLSAAPAAPPRGRLSTLIVPGVSIGPARLGMSPADADAVLGPSTDLGADKRAYTRFDVVVTFDEGAAAEISTQAAKYRTATGAGVQTAASDTARLVGDANAVADTSEQGTTVWYAFQGIGFVFRDGRAVEAFILRPMVLAPPPPGTTVTASPTGAAAIVVSGGPPAPPARPGAPAASSLTSTPAAPGPASIALRDVTVRVLPTGGFTVAGVVLNTGAAPAGPILVAGAFTRASGDQAAARTIIPGPLAPGAGAGFAVQTAVTELALPGGVTADPVVRYQVAVTTAAGVPLTATGAETVPLSAYAEFARRQTHARLDVGAPSAATGPPTVQLLVSVDDTGTIPPQWIQQVTVVVPYVAGGTAASQTVQLRPGDVVTVLVPAAATLGAPEVTGVVLGGQ